MTIFPCHSIAIVSLTEATVERVSPESLQIGSMEELKALFPNDLVFSAGILTGSYAPASCAVSACVQGRFAFVKGQSGPAMRRCGLDALVVKGSAEKATAIILTANGGYLLPLDGSKDVPSLRKILAHETAALSPLFEPAVILTGPAAFAGASLPALSLNHGTAPGTSLLARDMAGRGLAGIAFAGQSAYLSPLAADHPIRSSVKPERVSRSNLKAILKTAFPSLQLKKLPEPGRSIACYACPTPCGFWIKPSGSAPVPCTSPDGLAILASTGADVSVIASILTFAETYGLDPAGLTIMTSRTMPRDLSEWLAEEGPAAEQATDSPQDALSALTGICPFFLARHGNVATLLEAFLQQNK